MRYLLIVFTLAACKPQNAPPVRFNLGRVATAAEIKAWDIDVRPDGTGLPEGSGTVSAGREIYAAKCALCHGRTGTEGPYNILVGAIDDTTKAKTIGNYWPYATTLFDYTRRAMPYNLPGSLTDDEVYSITAFLLHANKIIDSTTEMNKRSLPAIVMPAQKYYVPDNRQGGPEVK